MGKSLTHEEYVKAVKEVNDKITVVGTYVNKSTKVKVKCNFCGREWEVSPYTPLNGRGCMVCANKNTNLNNMLDIKLIEDKAKELDCTILNRNKEKNYITAKCNKCGNIWKPSVNNFMQGRSKCHCGINVNSKKTTEDFKKELAVKNPTIEVIGEYVNNKTKILCRCKKCGAEFYKKPTKLLQGQSCICNRWFKSEREVYDYLTQELGFTVEQQKSFEDLLSDKGCRLSYDFYIELENRRILIERQGQQHRFPIDFNGEGKEVAQQNFERQLYHDELKRNYAKEHNYELIEIWYDEDYKEVLKKELK